ncbi:MAG: hypothetical protein JO088_08395, partial [Acidobacteria bacterium]|nr:hypothetical protein [Acidobacteriota bacterium]
MKRLTISILMMALLPFGCAKKDATASATTTQAAPALPSDVQNVAAAATATSTPATTTEAAAIASESGGTIVAT